MTACAIYRFSIERLRTQGAQKIQQNCVDITKSG